MTLDRSHLTELVHDLESMGLLHGATFFVAETEKPRGFTSETIRLYWNVDGEYEVYYRDMGRDRELLRTRDFGIARERFVGEVLELARGRGYGPLVESDAPLHDLKEHVQGVRGGVVGSEEPVTRQARRRTLPGLLNMWFGRGKWR